LPSSLRLVLHPAAPVVVVVVVVVVVCAKQAPRLLDARIVAEEALESHWARGPECCKLILAEWAVAVVVAAALERLSCGTIRCWTIRCYRRCRRRIRNCLVESIRAQSLAFLGGVVAIRDLGDGFDEKESHWLVVLDGHHVGIAMNRSISDEVRRVAMGVFVSGEKKEAAGRSEVAV